LRLPLLQTGKYKEAMKHAQRAALLRPADPMIHRNIARLADIMGSSLEAVKHNRIAIRLGPGMHAQPERGDIRAYRDLSLQLVATGQTKNGFALEHYDAHRALAGKQNILSLSEKTRELLQKTRTKV
jgi:tetratricopeptide (TPR) repeat protein